MAAPEAADLGEVLIWSGVVMGALIVALGWYWASHLPADDHEEFRDDHTSPGKNDLLH
ncbi:MAG: hypothetical protein AAB955_01370 [Patescibacteria group bacterium]